MKKLIMTLALAMGLSLTVFAQSDNAAQNSNTAPQAASEQVVTSGGVESSATVKQCSSAGKPSCCTAKNGSSMSSHACCSTEQKSSGKSKRKRSRSSE